MQVKSIGDIMNIQQKIITFVLLLIVSTVVYGCAHILYGDQTFTDSQAISNTVYNYHKNLSANAAITPISLPPIKRVGNQNKRLVLLNPIASEKWLRAKGFKVNITRDAVRISKKTGGSRGYYYSSRPRKYSKVDDPQYLQIGNYQIRITGITRWEGAMWITDQYGKLRVLTYE